MSPHVVRCRTLLALPACALLVGCLDSPTSMPAPPDAAPDARAVVPSDAPLPDACAPSAEVCDGFDNDCNDRADEPWESVLGTPCRAGVGACEAAGMMICDASGLGAVCTAVPGTPAPDDDCGNDVDDDCDGQVDELCDGPARPASHRAPPTRTAAEV